MARPNPLRAIMNQPLPPLTYQRRKLYRPDADEITWTYNKINYYVFEGALKRPLIETGNLQKCWGYCNWNYSPPIETSSSMCNIKLSNKWFCQQWFVNTLAHEMVHQWQWDVYRWQHLELYNRDLCQTTGAHGASFFLWRDRFIEYNLKLKSWHRMKKWFKFQDWDKC